MYFPQLFRPYTRIFCNLGFLIFTHPVLLPVNMVISFGFLIITHSDKKEKENYIALLQWYVTLPLYYMSETLEWKLGQCLFNVPRVTTSMDNSGMCGILIISVGFLALILKASFADWEAGVSGVGMRGNLSNLWMVGVYVGGGAWVDECVGRGGVWLWVRVQVWEWEGVQQIVSFFYFAPPAFPLVVRRF